MFALTHRHRARRTGPGLRAARGAALIAGGSAIALLAGCGTSAPAAGGSSASSGSSSSASPSASVLAGGSCQNSSATKITFWAWVPGMDRAVNEYNKTHSSVCVQLEDPGAGNAEYTLLNNAMKAGSGAPDVAEMEFDELPSFEVQHYLVDLSKYGANNYKSKFVPWAWSQVSRGSAVYAMPSDFGPMGFYYNAPLLKKYKVTPPATWADFATAAAKLHQADPSAYLLNFSPNDLQWLMSIMGQAGAWPFDYNGGSSVKINWTGPAEMKFAAYWQKLLDSHAISTFNDAGTLVDTNMDKGIIAAALYSAWAPSYFAPNAKQTNGKWRAAGLPQWSSGAQVGADWGGSTYPVFSQSQHPAQAAAFSEWLTATDASWNIVKTPPSSLFPTYVPLLTTSSFKGLTYPISGSSHPNAVFTQHATQIPATPWPPFMTQALTQANTTFGGVLTGKETLAQAFRSFQSQETAYAKAQGFTVTG
ncbi:MAG TPA: extracellular solute-binding protein [Streptosporangiaceae bacterium]|jgi:multiple sugar transport system substrate-binding protein